MEYFIDFIKYSYFIPIYIIAFAISVYRYPRYFDSILKYFPIIIGFTLLIEILGFLIGYYESFQIIYLEEYKNANYLIYNIYDAVFFIYFYYVYWKILKKSIHKNIVKYGAIVYLMACLTNPFFENVLIFPQIFASSIGSLTIVIATSLFLTETGLKNVKFTNLLVWISLGLLIFNLFFPLILIAGRIDYDLYRQFNFRQFHYFLIVAMYTCFIIGFIKMRRIRNRKV